MCDENKDRKKKKNEEERKWFNLFDKKVFFCLMNIQFFSKCDKTKCTKRLGKTSIIGHKINEG